MVPLPIPSRFLELARELGVTFESDELDRFGRFIAMLLDANQRFNLTSITDPDEAWVRHIFDSVTLLPYIITAEAKSVIDVGSGGGLPGIPLAIALPDVQFTLLEATGKKARFLDEAASAMNLTNVRVINDRAETLGQDHKHHRAHYDIAVTRAVGSMAVLAELTVPLVRVGGNVLAIKGEKAAQELSDAKAALHLLHCYAVGTAGTPTGTIVILEKQRATPRQYPRRPGEPKRAPLGVKPDAGRRRDSGDPSAGESPGRAGG